MPDAIDSVSLENWKSAVQHVIETEDTYWATDGMQYSQVDPVVITFGTQDDSDSSNNEDDSVLESISDDGEDTDTNFDGTDEEEGETDKLKRLSFTSYTYNNMAMSLFMLYPSPLLALRKRRSYPTIIV